MRFTDIVKINYKIVKSVILYKISVTSLYEEWKNVCVHSFRCKNFESAKSLGGIVQC